MGTPVQCGKSKCRFHPRKASLAARSAASRSTSAARRNGLAAFSSPRSDGSVGRSVRPQPPHLGRPRLQGRIVRIDAQREPRVGRGVFVAAQHTGGIGQGRKLAQAREHVGGGAFQQPPAAQAEQRVARTGARSSASKNGTRYGRAYAQGVSITLRLRLAQPHRVALAQPAVERRQALPVGLRSHHLAAEPRADRRHRGHVIAVVVREQDQVEPSARRLDRGSRPAPPRPDRRSRWRPSARSAAARRSCPFRIGTGVICIAPVLCPFSPGRPFFSQGALSAIARR